LKETRLFSAKFARCFFAVNSTSDALFFETLKVQRAEKKGLSIELPSGAFPKNSDSDPGGSNKCINDNDNEKASCFLSPSPLERTQRLVGER
jgi:hypothetical protein